MRKMVERPVRDAGELQSITTVIAPRGRADVLNAARVTATFRNAGAAELARLLEAIFLHPQY
jgi:hypothetical protein